MLKQINGTERRLFSNSQAELNNSKTWSGQLTSLVLSCCKASLYKGSICHRRPAALYVLLANSISKSQIWRQEKLHVSQTLKVQEHFLSFPSITFPQGQQKLPAYRCSWEPVCKPAFSLQQSELALWYWEDVVCCDWRMKPWAAGCDQGAATPQLSCLKAIFFFFFNFPRQNSCSYRSFRIFFH